MDNKQPSSVQKKYSPFGLIAGILCILNFIMLTDFSYQSASELLTIILSGSASAVLGIALIINKRNLLPIAGVALYALSLLLTALTSDKYQFFGYFLFLSYFLNFLAEIGLLFVVGVTLTNRFRSCKKTVEKCWFVPAVIGAVGTLLCGGMFLIFVLEGVLHTVITLFTALWAVSPNGSSKERSVIDCADTIESAYCELGKHVLLLIFTFGIWYLIWIYRMTDYLNCVEDEEPRNPTTKLLLCMFIPFYAVYWVYKSAQRIDKLAKGKGISSDLSTLCLILALFVGIVPPILMQDKMNAIITAGNSSVQVKAQPTAKNPNIGAMDELKKCKELLDSGVITQEEFDAKKKQLLNL